VTLIFFTFAKILNMKINKFFYLACITMCMCFSFTTRLNAQQMIWWDNFDYCPPPTVPYVCDPALAPAGNPGDPFHPWKITDIGVQGNEANDWYIFHPANFDSSNFFRCYSPNDSVCLRSLYIGYGDTANCDSALRGPVYRSGCDNYTFKRAESVNIDCSGHSTLIASFYFIAKGVDCNRDYCKFIYSADSGQTWTVLVPCLKSYLCYHFYPGWWTYRAIALPSSADNNPNVRIGFEWTNDEDCYWRDPSFAVDRIKIMEDTVACNFQVSITSEGDYLHSGDTVCAGTLINLMSNITNPNPNIIYTWSFQDTTIIVTHTGEIQHYYYLPGHYYITLNATDTVTGCYDRDVFEVHVCDFKPQAGISADNIYCGNGFDVNFTAYADTNVTYYHWDFGDGDTSNVMNPPMHTYATTGTYHVCLTTYNSNNIDCTPCYQTQSCIDISLSPQFPAPIITHSGWNTSWGGDSLTITNLASYNSNFVFTWTGANGGGTGTSFLATVPGHYQAQVEDTTSGCTKWSNNIWVYSLNCMLTAAIGFNGVPVMQDSTYCATGLLQVHYMNLTTGGVFPDYEWDFGDGTILNDNGSVQPHQYASTGVYTVRLTATEDTCYSTVTRNVVVCDAKPTISFYHTGCGTGNTINFTGNTSGPVTTYLWDFGDGTTSSLQNPSHTYSSTNTYNVCFTASYTSISGCSFCSSTQTCMNILVSPAFPDPTISNIGSSTLSLNSAGSYPGWVTYQWYTSPTVFSFVPISGETNTTYVYSVATDYYLIEVSDVTNNCVKRSPYIQP
jgi:PKD repeat protein